MNRRPTFYSTRRQNLLRSFHRQLTGPAKPPGHIFRLQNPVVPAIITGVDAEVAELADALG